MKTASRCRGAPGAVPSCAVLRRGSWRRWAPGARIRGAPACTSQRQRDFPSPGAWLPAQPCPALGGPGPRDGASGFLKAMGRDRQAAAVQPGARGEANS